MVEAVKALPQEIQDKIELLVWNILEPEGMNRKMSLHVLRMPVMALNNLPVFESTIPSEEELVEAILESYDNK